MIPDEEDEDFISLHGRLLVAEPMLRDPNFRRTVIYIIEHSSTGAIGLVVNRPGEVSVRDAIPTWAPYVNNVENVFVGGPVKPDGALCLARALPAKPFPEIPDDEEAAVRPITSTIGIVDLHWDPADVHANIADLRIFGGYAGWSAGQLEDELDAGGWIVLNGVDDDVFCARPDQLWRDVLARQPGELRARAFFPEDVTLN